MSIHDAKLPALSFYESFEERLHDGIVEAETLAHVVSLAGERAQIASKPEPPFQMGMASRRDAVASVKEEIHVHEAYKHGVIAKQSSCCDPISGYLLSSGRPAARCTQISQETRPSND